MAAPLEFVEIYVASLYPYIFMNIIQIVSNDIDNDENKINNDYCKSVFSLSFNRHGIHYAI